MTQSFNESVAALRSATQQLNAGILSGVAYRDAREPALAAALSALAEAHGVVLQQPLQVDANGEYSVVAVNPKGPSLLHGAGPFGQDFAAALTRAQARTGIAPGALCASNGWCRLNHLQAEKMVLEYAQKLQQVQPL